MTNSTMMNVLLHTNGCFAESEAYASTKPIRGKDTGSKMPQPQKTQPLSQTFSDQTHTNSEGD
ncbi:hypothetical protein CDL15_Pgr020747 [Punica granatum]|uniref:Uncharacterized protein n=1 Tax=Punica granatum TaxID=22663 RepID=A0A218XV08_PUNGR|nr:hypothetical protein CDL15_Pgr020747 [Punica granatum]